ncbi:DUF4262 domain-containing protein [Streptomyces sp. NPDC088707]|uniref:DUF4262 domain-containing protein n=1 Tax=Streptomyces sp. NPDC088707 TaxID=3365871 RepID=UPI0037F52EB8
MSVSYDLFNDNTNRCFPQPVFPSFPMDSEIIWVEAPHSDEPPFGYSLGLADQRRRGYEVAVFGLPAWPTLNLIGHVADLLSQDSPKPFEGLELDSSALETGYAARLRRVQDTSRLAGVAPDAPVWQVVVSDKWGHFPGNPRHRAGDPCVQPLP